MEVPTSYRIMVVDDAEDNRQVLSRYLKRAGYEVSSCEDGVAAMAAISASPPSLVMLDWMMPRLSGMEVLSSLRERFDATQLPIIMCTARDEAEGVAAALNGGANDYVTKPLNREVVLARVRAQLDRKAALDALASLNGDLEKALADRTRSLLDAQNRTETNAFAPRPENVLQEILRLTEWLEADDDADKPELRKVCAQTIASAARRLAAA